MAERASIIAIPWYRRHDYAALSKLFSDPENLPKTFEEWLELALLAEGDSRERAWLSRGS
jgi:hypothetical protein